ncbi:hypothetical protein L209DRAFT_563053 [Thermothelomyces heterothallicus CBS 203.75]
MVLCFSLHLTLVSQQRSTSPIGYLCTPYEAVCQLPSRTRVHYFYPLTSEIPTTPRPLSLEIQTKTVRKKGRKEENERRGGKKKQRGGGEKQRSRQCSQTNNVQVALQHLNDRCQMPLAVRMWFAAYIWFRVI